MPDGEGQWAVNFREQRGFTLLEVMAAVSLLGIAVSLLLTAVTQGMVTQASAFETSRALWLCQKTLHDVAFGAEGQLSGGYAPPWDRFSWRAEVQRLTTPPARRITVTVMWKGPVAPQSVSLSCVAEGVRP